MAPSVAVLGPGGIGGMLAALFWRAGIEVTCVAREETAEAISRSGLRLESAALGDFTAFPGAVARLDFAPDLLVIATKAPALGSALDRVHPGVLRQAVVLPLLNGIEHLAWLRDRLPGRVMAGSIGLVEARRVTPIHIEHTTSSARIEVACDGGIDEDMEALLAMLGRTGLTAVRRGTEAEVLWGKLVRLSALALTTAARDLPLGSIRASTELRRELVGVVRESAAVASAEGLPTDHESVMAQIDRLPAGLGTSLQRDVVAGRESELDAIGGAILRAAARHGLSCPTIASLVARIEARAVPGRPLPLPRA